MLGLVLNHVSKRGHWSLFVKEAPDQIHVVHTVTAELSRNVPLIQLDHFQSLRNFVSIYLQAYDQFLQFGMWFATSCRELSHAISWSC